MLSTLGQNLNSALIQLAEVRIPGNEEPVIHFWLPFGFLGVIAWSVWIARRVLTSFYRPHDNDFTSPVTVVAPAFREDPEILVAAIRSWLTAGADEIVLVFPDDEPVTMRTVQDAIGWDPRIWYHTTDNPAKRNSLRVGILAASKPIVVLSDSDTLWEPDCLKNLLMPFIDPEVGGVGTRQRVWDARSSVWRRAADWMLDAKYLTYVPAMARKGGVSCLSGRTVAYRREILLESLEGLTNEVFFGRKCVSGDDGRLTWLCLNMGYKTAYQINSVAWTMMPDNARGFFMQRLRWSRNSYRCYLRAVYRGWLFKQPMITRVSVLQGLLAPVSLTIGFALTGLAVARGAWLVVAIWLCWLIVGRGIRAFDHLRIQPRNITLLPMMTGIILVAMTAIKYYTFFTMNKQAWITRREDRDTAEGQGHTTLGERFGVEALDPQVLLEPKLPVSTPEPSGA